MTSYTIPKNLNGKQLLNELSTAGIDLQEVTVVNNLLWLNTNDLKAKDIVAKHVGVDTVPSAEQKLEAAGLTIAELKTILGL